MKNRKIGRKPDRKKIPVPTSKELIVLTGLVQMEAGESLGLELAFCTEDQNYGGAFFLGSKDMMSPNGDEALAARCPACEDENGAAKMHWVVDLRTAACEEMLEHDTNGSGFCLESAELLENLSVHESGSTASRAAARKWRAQKKVAS